MTRVSGHQASVATGRLWRMAILTAAGAIGVTSYAEAALYYWSDSDPGVFACRIRRAAAAAKGPPSCGKKTEAPERNRPSRRDR